MSLRDELGLARQPVFLIDGTAYVFRSFYAFQGMTRSDGFPTNALFNVLRMMLSLIRDENPAHLIFFLDGKGPTFRHDMFEPYKAQREATPEPLIQQLAPIREGIEQLGFTVKVSEGCEADDLIASAAHRFKEERPVVIIGADKDLKQCLDSNVYLYDPMNKKKKLTTVDEFMEESGLSPTQWPDFQALTGDSSDNIPGVPGVGPKTAQIIMKDFPTLESLRDGIDGLKPNLKKKVEPHLEDIFLYRELTRLRTTDCDDVALADLARRPADVQDVQAFFQEYELRSLVREWKGMHSERVPDKPAASGVQAQLSLLGPGPATAKADPVEQVALADLDLSGERSVGLAMGRLDGKDCVFLGTGRGELAVAASLEECLDRLSSLDTVFCHSLKDKCRIFPGNAIPAGPHWFDVGLAAYLLNPEDRSYDLDHLMMRHGPELDVNPANKGAVLLALGELLAGRMEGSGLAELMRDLETPLVAVLANMERRGMGVDPEAFASFLKEVTDKLEELTRSIHDHAGGPFNQRSSQQLARILFEDLGLKPVRKTSGGLPSTSVDVLERLEGEHPIIRDILEYRKLEKLRSTYLEPLPKLADGTGRIHSTFNQLATATGRLSSSNPNLQNIPIRGSMGGRMRSCFRAIPPEDGWAWLVAADYSQIELRVLAHVSREPALVQAFEQGLDIHSRTAGLIFDKDTDQVTKEDRRAAKTINFGLIYGMGPQKLARDLSISLKEAKAFIERYFERMPGLKTFFENVEADARTMGYVSTLAGRRRFLPDLHSQNNQLQSAARRQAVNTLIQGSAADIIKLAMLKVDQDAPLQKDGARLILQVHDELLLEISGTTGDGRDEARAAGERLQELMVGAFSLKVPLVVDLGVGKTWGEAHG